MVGIANKCALCTRTEFPDEERVDVVQNGKVTQTLCSTCYSGRKFKVEDGQLVLANATTLRGFIGVALGGGVALCAASAAHFLFGDFLITVGVAVAVERVMA